MPSESNLHKICLIFGNQQLLIDETAKSIIEDRLEGRQQEWALERFNANELLKASGESGKQNAEDLNISCQTLPMLTDRKVIRIDNFEMIKKSGNNFEKNNQLLLYEIVEKIIKSPPENIWIVLTSTAMREKDINNSLFKIIKQKGLIKKFTSYENSTPLNWVIQRGDTKGLPISEEAARLLIDIVGNDLMDLDHELEKLSLFFSGKLITEEMIKGHIRGHKHFSVFRMTEALSRKELLPALEILEQQLQATPREHVRIFSLIIMQFRRMLIIHSMLDQFYNELEIINKISLPAFLSKQVLAQAKNFTSFELQKIYTELSELDLRIKFQSSLAPLILQNLFQRICSGKFQKKEA